METPGQPGSTRNGGEAYRFGPFVVDSSAHTLTRDGEPQALEPKAFAVLLHLLRHAGELVRHDELLDAVWGHRHVTPGVLTRAVAQLRHVLEDDSHRPLYIQTQHGLGYRFIGELEPGAAEPVVASAAPGAASVMPVPVDAAGDLGIETSDEVSVARHGRTPARERRRFPRNLANGWWIAFALLLAGSWLWQQRRDATQRAAEPSIAVLPFTTLSSDREDRYFSEGLAAEMHGALASVRGLKVAAWLPPSARIAGEDVKALGRRLGVATVLDASVRREGQRVRISARLSDTRNGFTLWSRTYDRELSDIFATQSEIAHEVAASLVGVIPDSGEGLRRRLAPTRNVAAFDAYLRGVQQLLSRGGPGGEDGALGHFRQALKLDDGFARAQAGICRVELWRFEYSRDAKAFENARLACLRAENMDAMIGEVSLALGDLYRVNGDTAKAAGYYRRIEHDPALRAKALVGLAKLEGERQRIDLALPLFREALKASPGDAAVHAQMGYQQYVAGMLADAIRSLRRATELDPGNAYNWSLYGSLLMLTGDNDAAEHAFGRSLAIEPVEAVLSNLGTLKYQKEQYTAAADLYRQAAKLNPNHFQVWGNLGDALLADPATTAQAADAYRRADSLTARAVEIRPDDAKAVAALGWFRANLGDRAAALDLAKRSAALPGEEAEVAYYNAETYALLGEREQAARSIDAARRAGIADIRIRSNAVLRRNGLAGTGQGARQ